MSDEPTFDPRRKAAIRELVVDNAAAHPGRAGGRKRTALVATLVVLALTISGGSVAYALGTGLIDFTPIAAPSPTPTVTPTPTPTPTPTSTPTPAVPVQDPADPSTWVIGFDGAGPLRLGPPLATQTAELPDFVDKTDPLCTGSYAWLTSPNGSRVGLVAGSDGSDRTAAIILGSDGYPDLPTSPTTAAGIGVGSTLEQLQAAYPDIQLTGSYAETVYYYGITDGAGGWIVFSVLRNYPDDRLNDKVTAVQIANESELPAENGSVKTMPHERCPA